MVNINVTLGVFISEGTVLTLTRWTELTTYYIR